MTKGEHILTIKLKGEFTDLNTYIQAERGNRFVAAKIKQQETDRVIYETKKYRKIIQGPVHIRFDWYVKNKKKDADNISFSKKFILDGMVKAGVLQNDTQKFVTSFEDYVHATSEPTRVEVRFFNTL